MALVFIDLDGFKTVNDRYGHVVADRLLFAIGARIAAGIRAEDIACRYGGDEFVALLTKLNDAALLQHADAAMFRDQAAHRAASSLCEMNDIASAANRQRPTATWADGRLPLLAHRASAPHARQYDRRSAAPAGATSGY